VGEALKITTYILNRVLTKVTTKIPSELLTGRKLSIKHLHIWGCLAEAQPYRPKEKKLESTNNYRYFIKYFEHSRGYKFYDPTLKTIFEMGTT